MTVQIVRQGEKTKLGYFLESVSDGLWACWVFNPTYPLCHFFYAFHYSENAQAHMPRLCSVIVRINTNGCKTRYQSHPRRRVPSAKQRFAYLTPIQKK